MEMYRLDHVRLTAHPSQIYTTTTNPSYRSPNAVPHIKSWMEKDSDPLEKTGRGSITIIPRYLQHGQQSAWMDLTEPRGSPVQNSAFRKQDEFDAYSEFWCLPSTWRLE